MTKPSKPTHWFKAVRRLLIIAAPFALIWSVVLPACRAIPEVPFRAQVESQHLAADVPAENLVDLWVSYQIVVDGVDGASTNYRAMEPCVYFKLSLPAGEHSLDLRLDYRSATHQVNTTESVNLPIQLVAGESYRLLDLASQARTQRAFRPHLLVGAPKDQSLSLTEE
jgi:hypothetical protein